MAILRLVELFKNMGRPWRYLTAYFSESIKDKDLKFRLNHHSSLQFMLLKFEIDNFYCFETFCAFRQN